MGRVAVRHARGGAVALFGFVGVVIRHLVAGCRKPTSTARAADATTAEASLDFAEHAAGAGPAARNFRVRRQLRHCPTSSSSSRTSPAGLPPRSSPSPATDTAMQGRRRLPHRRDQHRQALQLPRHRRPHRRHRVHHRRRRLHRDQRARRRQGRAALGHHRRPQGLPRHRRRLRPAGGHRRPEDPGDEPADREVQPTPARSGAGSGRSPWATPTAWPPRARCA